MSLDFQTALMNVVTRRPELSPKHVVGRVEVPREWWRVWDLLPPSHRMRVRLSLYASKEGFDLLNNYRDEFSAYMRLTT
jgi:hypothetical protein